MNDLPTPTPLRFEPAMEHAEASEAETDRRLEETLSGIRETTFANTGHATRSVHAKSHGILNGTLTIPSLPAHLAQGLFAKPGSYPVTMRFSTIPGDMLDDSVSTPRGLAFKIVGVEGARLPGSEDAMTQDFVMVNAPAFSAPTAEKFLGSLKMLATTTDKVDGLKTVVSRIARGTEALLEAFGTKSALVSTMGGQPATNMLGETYYTQTPFLFGPYVAKFSLAPVSPGLTALTNQPVDVNGKPDALREAVIEHFGAQGGDWELRVQLATDAETMPVEDASVPWPEDASPYVTVAHLSVASQNAWSARNVKQSMKAYPSRLGMASPRTGHWAVSTARARIPTRNLPASAVATTAAQCTSPAAPQSLPADLNSWAGRSHARSRSPSPPNAARPS